MLWSSKNVFFSPHFLLLQLTGLASVFWLPPSGASVEWRWKIWMREMEGGMKENVSTLCRYMPTSIHSVDAKAIVRNCVVWRRQRCHFFSGLSGRLKRYWLWCCRYVVRIFHWLRGKFVWRRRQRNESDKIKLFFCSVLMCRRGIGTANLELISQIFSFLWFIYELFSLDMTGILFCFSLCQVIVGRHSAIFILIRLYCVAKH